MTEAQAIEAISARFAAAWPVESAAAAAGGVPFMLDNERDVAGDLFASLSIRPGSAPGQTTVGARGTRRWQRGGAIYVRIWTPAGAGAAGGAALCDAARRVFEGETFGGDASGEPVTVLAGDSQPPQSDDRWWMSTVIFRYRFAELR